MAISQNQLSEESFTQKERKSSSKQERRKGNITQLDEAIQDLLSGEEVQALLERINKDQAPKIEEPEKSSLPSSSILVSSKETILSQEIPMPSSSSQEVSVTEQNKGDRISSPSIRRRKNFALVDMPVKALVKNEVEKSES
ncbi:hypothetical protein IM40_00625 [Candidatus Paracaedimonas acanthamoebae]|nr:hypothetical protein IM40_00625 [Candidatus Paracaedimonas acanthamoebae]